MLLLCRGNVAAGSQAFGVWFDGSSFACAGVGNSTVAALANTSIHSSAEVGLLVTGPDCPDNSSLPTFQAVNLTVQGQAGTGVVLDRLGAVSLQTLRLADNQRQAFPYSV